MIDLYFKDREFNQAIDDLANDSRRDDIEVLTGQAIHLTRALASSTRFTEHTRRLEAGRARAGWFVAWLRLGVRGVPQGCRARVLSAPEGDFVDGRSRLSEPFVEITNEVNYIDKLDKKDNILQKAVNARFSDMQNELTRRYRKRLERASGR